jgi:hypothetical protein
VIPPDPKDALDEIEPLSEARWDRIKRSLFDKLDEEGLAAPRAGKAAWQRRIGGFVAAGAVAAALGALASRALWQPSAPPPPSLSHVAHIATAESESHVSLGGASLDVGPRSELDVSGDDTRGVRVHLDRGRVACAVAPRHGRPPFVVEAGDVLVRVVGTRLAVSRGDDGVAVDVTSGVVEVEEHGEIHRVGAGERWPALPVAATEAASPETRSPASAPPVEMRPASRAIAPAPAPRAPASAPETTSEAPPIVPPFAAPVTSPARRTPQERFESAAGLESTEPAAALAIYQDLARGDGPWAANALFAAGRLEADRGAQDDARGLLEQYLARFPHGANAADARDLLARLARGRP